MRQCYFRSINQNELMSVNLDALFVQALTLSDEARLQLAERLILSVGSDSALERQQMREVQKRREDVYSGKVKMEEGEVVLEKIKKSLARRRSI